MFNLIRRISGSVIPRQDRPWAEDATSNAPHKRKRRLSWDENLGKEREKNNKRARGIDVVAEAEAEAASDVKPTNETAPTSPTADVKTVTKGVNEVQLEEKSEVSAPVPEPHCIPLPAEDDKEELETVPTITSNEEDKPTQEVEEAPEVIETSVDLPASPPAAVVAEGPLTEALGESEPEKATDTTVNDGGEDISVPAPAPEESTKADI